MQHVFIIGIGGAGTSALAELLRFRGVQVSGSDLAASAKTHALEQLGATICIGHREENIAADVDLVVYSSAVREDNPEFTAAKRRGIRMLRRANFMAELIQDASTIAVAGTHGKTTTTAMIAAILIEAGMDPTVLVGGSVPALDGYNARAGGGTVAVVEADEFDRSFLTLAPSIAVITSLEEEHLDIYHDLRGLQSAFVQFVNQGPEAGLGGFAVVCIDEPAVRTITPQLTKRLISYGISSTEAKYRATAIVQNRFQTRAQIFRGGELLGWIEMGVVGEHNVKNALAAIAVADIYAIPFERVQRALKHFRGAERRFQLVGESNGVVVIDDYAHHPTEIRATLHAARAAFPHRRIVACFQPHTYSRTKDFAKEFGAVLAELADEILLLDVYPAREAPLEGVSSDLIELAARKAGAKELTRVATITDLPAIVAKTSRSHDVILTIGAGTITEAAQEILKLMKARNEEREIAPTPMG